MKKSLLLYLMYAFSIFESSASMRPLISKIEKIKWKKMRSIQGKADSTIIVNGTLMWNMNEISPHGIVKEIPVTNWGQKYEPRVWCCSPALLDFERLAIIQQTWGKYCDKLLFFIGDNTQTEVEVVNVTQKLANGSDYTLYNVVKLDLQYTGDGLEKSLFEKIWKMQRYLYEHHENEWDWLARVEMDAWFSTPNFKGFAQYFDPKLDWWFGEVLPHTWSWGNMVFMGGGCNVLSYGAIKKLVRIYATDEFLHPANPSTNWLICHHQSLWNEDVQTAVCLKSVGIFATNSLDTQYRTRFCQFAKPYEEGMSWGKWWFFENRFPEQQMGTKCCAEHMITFHFYKDLTTLFDDFSNLDAIYSEPSKDNWINHQIPPKPVTFLFDDSFADKIVDEYFNIANPPQGQKIWKGVDNLWNYKDADAPTISSPTKSQSAPTTLSPTVEHWNHIHLQTAIFKNQKLGISISALVGLFIMMIMFGFCQAWCVDWMCCRK